MGTTVIEIQTQPKFEISVESATAAFSEAQTAQISFSLVLFLPAVSAEKLSSERAGTGVNVQSLLAAALANIISEQSTVSVFSDCLARKIATTSVRETKKSLTKTICLELPIAKALCQVFVVPLDLQIQTYQLLTKMRALASSIAESAESLFVTATELPADLALRATEALVSALTIALKPVIPASKDPENAAVQDLLHSVHIALPSLSGDGLKNLKKHLQTSVLEASHSNLARHLAFLPANILTTKSYKKYLESEFQGRKLEAKFLDKAELKRLKAGAFLAVAATDPDEHDGIFVGKYKPEQSRGKIAIVGKGMVYDTGGLDIKVDGGMRMMQGDMQGSAIALGLFLTLVEEKFPFEIELLLGIAENKIGPNSYRPGDVVRARNGMTIEVVNTDAEGRMVLADTLCIASENTPDIILDFATLTGSCVKALGTHYNGVYTNRIEWINTLLDAGRVSGERAWVFPNDDDYGDKLKSDFADIKQCDPGKGPDHIIAGQFLKQFVSGIPYVHVDLSTSDAEGGATIHLPGPFTGCGVRYGHEFLRQWSTSLFVSKD